MDLISVIIPVYQAEKYLDRCVSSVVNSTYQYIEVLLIDDGSTDHSSLICDRWAKRDSRIRVIHKNNGGVSSARNRGLEESVGNYIIMVDSDDYISKDFIMALYNRAKADYSDLVICGFEKGQSENYVFNYDNLNDSVELINAEEAMRRSYKDSFSALMYIAPWGKLYRKDLFKGINYPEGKIFEDIYITHQLIFKANKISIIPNQLVYYYEHDDSIMHQRFHVGKLDYLDALKERIQFFNTRNLSNLVCIAYEEYLHALVWEYSRTRDILSDKNIIKDIIKSYRDVYHLFYKSKRYKNEGHFFLLAFYLNPEIIINYWRIKNRVIKVLKNERK